MDRIREVRGLDGRIPTLLAPQLALPGYVPMIPRSIVGLENLDETLVAVPIGALFRSARGSYTAIASSGIELRRKLGLREDARVVAVGVARDSTIERYWQQRRVHHAAEALAHLDLAFVTCPNYSFFDDAPRLHTVWNRHRMICVMEELTAAGVPVVPHVNALVDDDWSYWRSFLCRNSASSFVAKEFQTGGRYNDVARGMIQRLKRLEDAVGRPLHVLAIAGGRLAPDLRDRLGRVTVIDSTPFMKAVKRKRRLESGGWQHSPTRPMADLSALLQENIDAHRRWILDRRRGAALPRG